MWIGYQHLRAPIEVPTGPMLWAAAGGLLTEVYALWLLFGKQKDNLNMKEAIWHIMQTFVGSFIIIVAALVKDMTDQKEILRKIHNLLKKDFSVYFSTIQIETECLDDKEVSDIDICAHASHATPIM